MHDFDMLIIGLLFWISGLMIGFGVGHRFVGVGAPMGAARGSGEPLRG